MDQLDELAREARLADPRLADDGDDPATAPVTRCLECPDQHAELLLSVDDRRVGAPLDRRSARDDRDQFESSGSRTRPAGPAFQGRCFHRSADEPEARRPEHDLAGDASCSNPRAAATARP